MVDAVIPAGTDVDAFAERYVRETLPTLEARDAAGPRERRGSQGHGPADGPARDDGPSESARAVRRARRDGEGRDAAAQEAIKVERDAFLDVATSPEGKAGMRFFFTQQAVQRLPKGFPGKARDLKKVGVDGADGFMGNAIAWLALEAGYDVVAHVPIEKFVPP
jgi:hypothetical protein